MKKLILILAVVVMAPLAWASMDKSTVETSTPVAQASVQFQPSSHAFYYCKRVPGGYQRCSKRNGRCFGAVFRVKHQCEDALHPDDD